MLKKTTFTCIHRRNREKPSDERRVPQLSALCKIWMNILKKKPDYVMCIYINFFTSLCAVYHKKIWFQFDKKRMKAKYRFK